MRGRNLKEHRSNRTRCGERAPAGGRPRAPSPWSPPPPSAPSRARASNPTPAPRPSTPSPNPPPPGIPSLPSCGCDLPPTRRGGLSPSLPLPFPPWSRGGGVVGRQQVLAAPLPPLAPPSFPSLHIRSFRPILASPKSTPRPPISLLHLIWSSKLSQSFSILPGSTTISLHFYWLTLACRCHFHPGSQFIGLICISSHLTRPLIYILRL